MSSILKISSFKKGDIYGNMSQFNKDCTVLVTSCDKYRDIDGPFIKLWRKFWPDCPFEVVLLTESEHPLEGEFGGAFDRVISVGKGKSWSESVVEAIEKITTPYVILQMNDYFPYKKVDSSLLISLLEVAKGADALLLRMIPRPPADGEAYLSPNAEGVKMRVFPKNKAYAASCQPGYWNAQFLKNLALKNKSAWEFERYGSYMFDLSDSRPVLMTEEETFPGVDALHKGYWTKDGAALLKREGIAYDFSKRGFPPFFKSLILAFKRLVFAVFPWEVIVRVQNIFNAGMK